MTTLAQIHEETKLLLWRANQLADIPERGFVIADLNRVMASLRCFERAEKRWNAKEES